MTAGTRTRATTTVVPFRALDGRALTLLHVTADDPPTRGPVLLVHGAGVRAEIFRPPVPTTFVDELLDAGWDVWLLNWRASIDLAPVPWTLDQAAAFDHPAAVREVLRRTGADTLKAVVHCQGSTSFVMSAVAGLMPEVETIVSNAVSLHPVVPRWSQVKIRTVPPVSSRLIPHVSPAWGDRPRGWVSRALATGVRTAHNECDNDVCAMVSFTYGAGKPALWSHATLDEATHDWLRGEFAEVPFSFFAQMARSIAAGQMVGDGTGLPGLPQRYAESAPRTDARFALFAGADNLCFLPESQMRSWDFLREQRPAGDDTLHVVPDYGHLDMFLGARAAQDVFPLMLDELAR
jgi:hypothetical protein